MKRRIYAVLVLLAVSVLGTACASEGEGTVDSQETETADYRVMLTDEEMEAGYAKFQMDERIYVEASITPTTVYETGVNSYFVVSLCNPDEEAETIFGYSMDEFYALLAEYSSVDFSEGTKNCIPEICWLRLNTYVACNPAYIYPNGFLPDYKLDTDGELSWSTEEEQGQELLELLEKLTEVKVSENWKCVTYSQENLAEALDTLKTETGYGAYYTVYDDDTNELIYSYELDASDFREFYSFWFSYDINGIPTSLCPLSSNSVSLGEEETPGEYLYELSNGMYLIDGAYLDISPIQIGVCEDGIFYMDIGCGWSLGDVYKESEEVLAASVILERCEGYLQSEIIVDTLTVTDVSLVYDLGYTDTDKEDGVVEAVLRPYWVVSAYNSWSRTHKAFIFDARTGNLVNSKEYYLD